MGPTMRRRLRRKFGKKIGRKFGLIVGLAILPWLLLFVAALIRWG